MSKILIKNAIIVTMDKKNTIINGDLLIDNSRISKIAEKIPTTNDVSKVIDAKGNVIMPGLINCHTQVGKTLFRGHFDDFRNDDKKANTLKKYECKLTFDDIYVASMLSFVEMIKSGTTCFNDKYSEGQHTARAANQVGIRGFVSYTIENGDEEYLNSSKYLFEYCNENTNRIKVSVAIPDITKCTKDNIEKALTLSKMQNTIINADISETKDETRYMYDNKSQKAIDFYSDAGLFNSKTILNHGTWLDEYDLSELKLHDTSIVNCPVSNSMQGSGIADIKFLMDSNVNIALGSDSIEKSGTLDMFEEMKNAAYSQKLLYKDAEAIDSEEVLRMATINGAKALGIDKEVGSIEVGKKADIIIVDINKPHLVPVENIYNTLAYHATGADVITSIIDGKIVMLDRKIVNINETEVVKKAVEMAKRMS